jgi:hypothetical protein
MKKTFSLFSMAALFFVGAIVTGCSNEDESMPSAPQPTPSKSITLTTTVSRDGEGDTRAVTEGGVKTFAVGEQIAVIYTNTSSQRVVAVSNALTVGDITNEGKDAKITVTLTDPVAGSVDYIYPANMANSDGTTNNSALCMQDGTWATLSSKLDYAKGSGEMTGSGSEFTLPSIALANQLAICKFKVKNSGSEITGSITGLTVSDGINTYTVSRPATDAPVYMAIQPVSSDKTLSFVASNATDSYYKNVTSLTLAANNIYPLNVTMTQGQTKDLATIGAGYEAQNGDMLTGKLAANHKISIAAGATVTLQDVDINYSKDLSGSFAGISCLGNATLIVNGTNYAKGFSTGYPGIFIPSASTLTITGDGTLYALGQEYGAGIGSGLYNINDYKDCGNIVIQGGTIWATGGGSAAGIGSGASIIFTQYDTGTPSTCGNITIKSSATEVYATAGSGAESIGKGQYSDCSTITIEDPNNVTQYQ